MAQRAKTKDRTTGGWDRHEEGQAPPREVEKRRGPPGPPAADAAKTADVRRSEPSEDFAQRDIESANEALEQHDRSRHDRGGGQDAESGQPA